MSAIFRILFKLLLSLFALVFVVSLLVAGLVAVVVTVVWALLRGRKPAVFTTVSRFRQASHKFRQGTWSGPTAPPSKDSDVVDVQAREVPRIHP